MFQSAVEFPPDCSRFVLPISALCSANQRQKTPLQTFLPSPVAHRVLLSLKGQKVPFFSALAPPKILTLHPKKPSIFQVFHFRTIFSIVTTSITFISPRAGEENIGETWSFKLYLNDLNCFSNRKKKKLKYKKHLIFQLAT